MGYQIDILLTGSLPKRELQNTINAHVRGIRPIFSPLFLRNKAKDDVRCAVPHNFFFQLVLPQSIALLLYYMSSSCVR